MRKIPTESIQPGSVTAADVVSASGNVLVNKGTTLTPALGRRLRNWGIFHVFVEGKDDSGGKVKAEAASPVKIRSELYDIFLGTLDDPRMKKIFHAVCGHKLQKGGGA